jgi:hypothetical protein
MELELEAEKAHQSHYDEVNGHDIIEKPWHDQDQDAGDQGEQRLQGYLYIHRAFLLVIDM